MLRSRSINSFEIKKAPIVYDFETYLIASTPSKHNSILASKDESFLKEVYLFEPNAEWRKMCVVKMCDQTFLKKVAINDSDVIVRSKALWNISSNSFILARSIEDNASSIRKYAKGMLSRLTRSQRFILGIE